MPQVGGIATHLEIYETEATVVHRIFEATVTDNGPGVQAIDRQRILERFVRLNSARTYQGAEAGLGLAIVKEIVSAHGGRVRAEDVSQARDSS